MPVNKVKLKTNGQANKRTSKSHALDYLNGYIRNFDNSSNNLNLKKMTIDKIQSYMSKDVYDYWTSCTDITAANKAKELLKAELSTGLLYGVQYQAELQLLQNLTEAE